MAIREIRVLGDDVLTKHCKEITKMSIRTKILPTAEELRSRLTGRGTESAEVIEGRMKRAAEEAEFMDRYDYLIINDVLDECVEEMHQIIQGEHRRGFRNTAFMEHMKEELKGE